MGNKERLFEIMSKVDPTFKHKLNEDVYNDAGEPNMTHSQFRNYSEPAEQENDDRNEPYVSLNFNSIVKELERIFDTILYGDSDHKDFLSNEHDIMLYGDNGKLSVYIDTKKMYENYFGNVNIEDLIILIKPYENTITKGSDAEQEMNRISSDSADDSHYARQEKNTLNGY